MSEPVPEPRRGARGAESAARRGAGITVVGVLGELLLTAGVLILLFLGWQLWWNDAIMAGQQSEAAGESSASFAEQDRAQHDPSATPVPVDPTAEPIVDPTTYADGETFAVMYIPRFNAPDTFDSVRNIAQGTGLNVLNSYSQGVGHYPSTAMPGAVGNFAIAAHRSAYGGGMHEIEQFQLGDAIYIQTKDGWYTYRFRDFEYVTPETTDVLAPVPHRPDLQPTDRIITLTSCNPLYSTAERIIAYGVLESFQPGAATPPAEIADAVASWES